MSMPGIKRYTFESVAQWKSGASRQLAFESEVVSTSARYAAKQVAGTTRIDRSAAITDEYCADLIWLRRSYDLVRNTTDGLRVVNRLSVGNNASTWKPRSLVSGRNRLWLLLQRKGSPVESRVLRYDSQGRYPRQIDGFTRPVLAMASDRRDGIWAVVGGDDRNAEAIHIESNGDIVQHIAVGAPLRRAAVDTTCDGKRIVILDYKPQIDECEEQKGWRLWLADLCVKDECGRPHPFKVFYALPKRDRVCHSKVPNFRPQLLAIDKQNNIHVLQRKTGELWTLDFDGYVIRQHSRTLDQCELPIAGLTAHTGLSISARRGVFRLRATNLAETTSKSYSPAYVTPTLTSPDGETSGWLRADIDVELPKKVLIEVDVATSNDKKVAEQISQILADDTVPKAAQLAQVESRLTWDEKLTRRFQANDEPLHSIHVPLHTITETYVWLRIRITTESGAHAPTLYRMRVYYPNISYLQYLPAVYRENEAAAAFLRSFIATFETLFGNLDTELAELPARIDPATAPDDWLPYLLRWLGLPAAPELTAVVQQKLLMAAPELLRTRGTVAALENFLAIVSGPGFDVVDSGRGPNPWVLPDACRSGAGIRLGDGTLVLSQMRPAFRLGLTSHLKSRRLGYQKVDQAQLFLRRYATVEVRIVAEQADRERLRELLDRYLPYFIPAHCRYTLRFVAASELQGYGRLDEDLRFAQEAPRRLGDASTIGTLPLGAGVLAESASALGLLDTDLYLS